MPSKKRPLCSDGNDQIQSKKAKILKAIQVCMTKQPVVKLKDVVEEINQKKTLFKLIRNHNLTSLQELLTLKVNVHIRDSEGSTPLHLAVELGYLNIVKLLVQNGANIGAKKYLSETPLQTAVINDRYEISEYLLENGAEVNSDDFNYYGPLMLAVMDCRVDMVKLLLSYGAMVNVEYCFETPLQMAIKNQHLEMIQVLLDNGANPNYYGDSDEIIPAMEQALELRNLEIIKMLLSHGADGGLFLEQAINSTNNLANVKMLLNNGLDANVIRNDNGWTPLHNAIDVYGNIDLKVLNLLIGFGADVNAKDFALETPLHVAFHLRVEDLKILKVLMQNGANPNLKDEDRESTIEKALKHKTTNYFKAILYNQNHF